MQWTRSSQVIARSWLRAFKSRIHSHGSCSEKPQQRSKVTAPRLEKGRARMTHAEESLERKANRPREEEPTTRRASPDKKESRINHWMLEARTPKLICWPRASRDQTALRIWRKLNQLKIWISRLLAPLLRSNSYPGITRHNFCLQSQSRDPKKVKIRKDTIQSFLRSYTRVLVSFP